MNLVIGKLLRYLGVNLGVNEWWIWIICGNKTLNKFQTFEGSQYFSADIREKDTLVIKL